MGFFRRNKAESVDSRARLPQTLPAQCLGEQCVNFSGVACASYADLLQADGKSGGPNLPPYADEASYAIYGNICTAGEEEKIAGISTVALKPEEINPAKMIALSGRYGNLPQAIMSPAGIEEVVTLASSEDQPL